MAEESENLSQRLSGEEGIEQRLISLGEVFEIAECLHPFLEPYSGEEGEREMEERIHRHYKEQLQR